MPDREGVQDGVLPRAGRHRRSRAGRRDDDQLQDQRLPAETGLRRNRCVLHGRLREHQMNSMQFKTLRWFAAAMAVAVLAGCSGGGAPTTENPVVVAPDVPDYVGPAAANADVQAFRINLWQNIKANNRCG